MLCLIAILVYSAAVVLAGVGFTNVEPPIDDDADEDDAGVMKGPSLGPVAPTGAPVGFRGAASL